MSSDQLSSTLELETFRPHRLPKYRRHKASGQGVATIGGKDFYFGPYGTKASKADYDRRCAEWLAAKRPNYTAASASGLTVSDLILRFWKYAATYYPASTLKGTIKPPLRRLRVLYGPTPTSSFGPLALKAFRQYLLDERRPSKSPDGPPTRLSRRTINRFVCWVRRVFKWAESEQLVPASLSHALATVEGLKSGRTDAPETPPVLPVPDAIVDATLPHLPPVVADMVRVQRLTGMRPGEVCRMVATELDIAGDVWLYKPNEHKTAHHGKVRTICIGPKAQAILRPYLRPDRIDLLLFKPQDAEIHRRGRLRTENQTPFTPSRLRRDAKRAAHPKRKFNERYEVCHYARAIRRACKNAGVPCWAPNQLRHAKATEIRQGGFGLEGAGAVLGHSKLETTQIYAERDEGVARRIALATG